MAASIVLPFRLGGWLLLLLVCTHSMSGLCRGTASAQEDELFETIANPLWEKYDALPPKGKFATGAFAGFAVTRIAIGTVTKTIKFAGAAFIVTEVMNVAGVFDNIDMPDLSETQTALLNKARLRVTGAVNGFRKHVRQQLTPEQMQANFDAALKKERMATLGAATGAFVGFAL